MFVVFAEFQGLNLELSFYIFRVYRRRMEKPDDPQNIEPRQESGKKLCRTEGHKRHYKCTICDRVFGDGSNLKKHLRVHNGERPFKCETCGKVFTDGSNLKVHIRVHTGERPYKCETCGKGFSQIGTLNAHVRVHTGENPYKCETCGKGFPQQGSLKTHVRVHTGEKPYKCGACNKSYAKKSALGKHMSRMHSHECETCDKKFISKDLLTMHSCEHTGKKKPFKCETCGRRYALSKSLKRHLLSAVHAGDGRLKCKTCEKRFTTKYALKEHVRRHTGSEKLYKCEKCGEEFALRLSLQLHMSILEKRPSCEQCGKRFSTKCLLARHRLSVHAADGENSAEGSVGMVSQIGLQQDLVPARRVETGHPCCENCGKLLPLKRASTEPDDTKDEQGHDQYGSQCGAGGNVEEDHGCGNFDRKFSEQCVKRERGIETTCGMCHERFTQNITELLQKPVQPKKESLHHECWVCLELFSDENAMIEHVRSHVIWAVVTAIELKFHWTQIIFCGHIRILTSERKDVYISVIKSSFLFIQISFHMRLVGSNDWQFFILWRDERFSVFLIGSFINVSFSLPFTIKLTQFVPQPESKSCNVGSARLFVRCHASSVREQDWGEEKASEGGVYSVCINRSPLPFVIRPHTRYYFVVRPIVRSLGR